MSSNTHCTRTHDSLKISNGKWCWWSRGIGGRSALDYLTKVKGLSFLEAVEQIIRRAAIRPPVSVSSEEPKPKMLLLPKTSLNTIGVETYLNYRGIDSAIIKYCIDTGRLYESPRYIVSSGMTYINAVSVGFDTGGTAKYATLRGIGSDFKGEATGSDKRYSFNIPAEQPNENVHLFESYLCCASHNGDYE